MLSRKVYQDEIQNKYFLPRKNKLISRVKADLELLKKMDTNIISARANDYILKYKRRNIQ